VQHAYRLALARRPDATETARAITFLKDSKDPKAALVDFCHAIVNLNEFVFVD
jgi:hypothetical protein